MNLIIIIVLILVGSTSLLIAQTDPQPLSPSSDTGFTGMDVLFLVDQSGSMSGTFYTGQIPADPNNLRFQSMQFAKDWLGDFAHYAEPDADVRMAVVGFGDPERELNLDWTLLAPPNSDWENEQKPDLDFLLSQQSFGDRQFGYTNFDQALSFAQELFDRLPSPPNGGQNLRVIIVITDGSPCAVADLTDGINCTDTSANRAHLTRTQQRTAAAFPEPAYRIYYLGIDNPSDPTIRDYGDLWQNILREPNIPSRYRIIDSASGMTEAILAYMDDIRQQISNSLVTRPCPLTNGVCTMEVPPYVRLLRFNIFKADASQASNAVTLIRPDGVQVVGTDAGITVSADRANIEVWTVSSLPIPHGTWTVQVDTSSTSQVEVQIDEAYFQSELIFDANPEFFEWQSIPIAPLLTYDTSGGGSQPVEILPQFPIQMEALITAPDGTQQSLILPENTVDPLGTNRRPQYRGVFVPQQAGRHIIELVGRVDLDPIDPNDAPFIPLDTRTALQRDSIDVRNANVTVELDDLLLAQAGNWLQTDPAQLCVIVNDRTTGQRIPALNTLAAEAVLLFSDGTEQIEPLIYQTDQTSRCSFAGTVAPDKPGNADLFVRGYLTDTQTGSRTEVFQRTAPEINMVVAPLTYVELVITQPTDQNTNSNIIKPGPFWNEQPMVVRVAARNASDGSPVDLAALSSSGGTTVTMPVTAKVISGGTSTPQDYTTQLVNLGGGEYELRTFDFGPGSYQVSFEGVPLDLRVCHCAYTAASQTDPNGGIATQQIIDRIIPTEIIYWGVGILAAALALVFVFWILYRWGRDLRSNAPQGTVFLALEDDDPAYAEPQEKDVWTVNLGDKARNTQRFGRRQFGDGSPVPPFQYIEITNFGSEEYLRSGTVRVTAKLDRQHNGETKTVTVNPGDLAQELWFDIEQNQRWMIYKDREVSTIIYDDPNGY